MGTISLDYDYEFLLATMNGNLGSPRTLDLQERRDPKAISLTKRSSSFRQRIFKP